MPNQAPTERDFLKFSGSSTAAANEVAVLPFEHGQRQAFAAITRRRVVFDQAPARGEQLLEHVNCLVFDWRDLRPPGGAEASQHSGIDRVGFDTFSGGLGETAGLHRIDLDRR
jgi:hypothetical protein